MQQHQPHPAIGPHQRRGVPGNQRRGLPGGQLRGGGNKGAAHFQQQRPWPGGSSREFPARRPPAGARDGPAVPRCPAHNLAAYPGNARPAPPACPGQRPRTRWADRATRGGSAPSMQRTGYPLYKFPADKAPARPGAAHPAAPGYGTGPWAVGARRESHRPGRVAPGPPAGYGRQSAPGAGLPGPPGAGR